MPVLVHGKMTTLLAEMEQSRGGSSWVEMGQIYSVGSKNGTDGALQEMARNLGEKT